MPSALRMCSTIIWKLKASPCRVFSCSILMFEVVATSSRLLHSSISLLFEKLYTVVSQVEACLNSRPITPLSENPCDLDALTPGHFFIGTSLLALPQEDVSNLQSNRLSRYQHLTQMIQHFWTRWSKDYLSSLQCVENGEFF
uniref:DUF5641 domain-containing protein n=1 Tax=Anoplophora glabripennis TaxID=217634 RepID=V5GQ81_ANOGL